MQKAHSNTTIEDLMQAFPHVRWISLVVRVLHSASYCLLSLTPLGFLFSFGFSLFWSLLILYLQEILSQEFPLTTSTLLFHQDKSILKSWFFLTLTLLGTNFSLKASQSCANLKNFHFTCFFPLLGSRGNRVWAGKCLLGSSREGRLGRPFSSYVWLFKFRVIDDNLKS